MSSSSLPHLSARRSSRPSLATLRHDAVAGLVVGIIALPLSIALAVAVGVPPIAGLYTAAFAGAVASLAGGSRYNITGPTAALVPLLAHLVLRHGPRALPVAGFLAGLLLLVMSALRFGRLVRYMPGVVVVGFTAGIALSIGFGQVNSFLAVAGTDPHLEHFHAKLWDTLTHLATIRPVTPLLGLGSLLLLILWPRFNRRVPAALVAVTVMTAITWGFDLDTPTIAGRYGDLPSGLPAPSFAFLDLDLIIAVFPTAVAIAVLCAVESLLSAVVADGMSGKAERHDPDAELRGQGLANLIAPLMGGIPATAAIARTAAGIRSGAATRFTGVFHALIVLVMTLSLGPLVGHIPLATLAAILLVVAWNIAEVPEVVMLLRRAPREDVAVLVATALITLFLDLSYAIAFGVLASAVLLVRRLARVPAAQALLPDENGRIQQVSPALSALVQAHPEIAFFNAQGMISFHSAAAFEYELMEHGHQPLILRMKDIHHVDTTGLLTLEGIIKHRRHAGGRIVFTAVQPDLRALLDRFGITDHLGEENIFDHTEDAIYTLCLANRDEPAQDRPSICCANASRPPGTLTEPLRQATGSA